jgi:hypothetical protein
MLEKLLGVGSFGDFIDQLARHKAILPVFSGKFDFVFVIQTYAPAFLGCYTLIGLALVTSRMIALFFWK